jgi:hypothetical protein
VKNKKNFRIVANAPHPGDGSIISQARAVLPSLSFPARVHR